MTVPAHWRDLGPGIYLHVPFCRHRCGYCDFVSTTGGAETRAAYVRDLRTEIGLIARDREFEADAFKTIFLGGGTPSLLEGDQLAAILGDLRASFAIAPGAEITLEANPESLEPARLDAFLDAGVTRVSLGVQSLDDRLLQRLERVHDAALARRRAGELKERGVSFSIDLIYGLPGLDARAWGTTLGEALALGSDHLSSYLLTLEPGTPMHAAVAAGEVVLPDEDEARDQYEMLVDRAEEAGLDCYEISNFARPGHESRHNQNYWVRGEYLGLGPSAHSHRAGQRWSNEADLAAWSRALRAGDRPVAARERLDARVVAEEWIFLGLRRSEGVPWDVLAAAAGAARGDGADAEALERRIAFLEGHGLVVRTNGQVQLAPAGRFVSDAVFADLMAALGGTNRTGKAVRL